MLFIKLTLAWHLRWIYSACSRQVSFLSKIITRSAVRPSRTETWGFSCFMFSDLFTSVISPVKDVYKQPQHAFPKYTRPNHPHIAHKCHVLTTEKVKMLFPQKEHERYWDPFFLKLPARHCHMPLLCLKMLPGPDFSDDKPFRSRWSAPLGSPNGVPANTPDFSAHSLSLRRSIRSNNLQIHDQRLIGRYNFN
jgi:hypothetical protein